jgi:hypothetical protein
MIRSTVLLRISLLLHGSFLISVLGVALGLARNVSAEIVYADKTVDDERQDS